MGIHEAWVECLATLGRLESRLRYLTDPMRRRPQRYSIVNKSRDGLPGYD